MKPRGRPKKQILESEPEPIQQESHSPIYATIQRNRSIDRTSFATVAVNSSIVQTPKPSTFKRIQSFFRATPSRPLNSLKTTPKNSIFSVDKFNKN